MNASDDMSDSDVLTAVRDRLSGIPLASPPDVDAIMARGRARRNRRLIPAVTGTLAAAAVAALAVATLAPGAHPAGRQGGHQPAAQLAAWTVTKLADGNISVTIRELTDPAGLHSTLRVDGVPASVTFAGRQNPACRPYPGGTLPPQLGAVPTLLLRRVFPKPYREFPRSRHVDLPQRLSRVGVRAGPPTPRRAAPPRPSANQTVIVIDPSALPRGAGVQLAASSSLQEIFPPQVVHASSQCTGS